jgi:peptide/nickel transport system substrate-binding protein
VAVVDGDVWTAAIAGTAAHRGGTLRVRISADAKYPFRFDISYDTRVALLSGLVYDGLVGYRRAGGSSGGTLVPNLARDLPEPGPDGRTYLFRLRPNLRFSNGAPVTPEDVRASFERLLRTPGNSAYFPIRGATGCSVKRCDLSKGIETDPAARTVTIRLSKPDADFLHKITTVAVVPAGSPAHTRPPPGTGPYTFTRFARWRVQLVRNPHFHVWSPDARPDGFPDQIAVRLGAPRAEVAAVQDGVADVALFYYGMGQVARLLTRYGARLHADPGPRALVRVPERPRPAVRRRSRPPGAQLRRRSRPRRRDLRHARDARADVPAAAPGDPGIHAVVSFSPRTPTPPAPGTAPTWPGRAASSPRRERAG